MVSRKVSHYKLFIYPLVILTLISSILVFHRSAQAQAGYLRLERVIDTSELGVTRVSGLSYDGNTSSFTVYGEHAAVKMDLFERARGSAPLLVGAGQALNVPHPATGNQFKVDVTSLVISEFTPSGQQVAVYDLGEFGLVAPSAVVFAPSGDQTDDPAEFSLYVADAGSSTQRGGVYEFSLVASAPIAPQATLATVTLVNLFQTWTWATPSPDPSGLDYVPSLNSLIFTDSEVDELPIYQGKNIYVSDLAGSLLSTCSLSLLTNEPTGITYDEVGGRVFVSDDVKDKIFIINVGPDGSFCTPDDTSSQFDTTLFGSMDSEGVGYGAGKLYIGGGINHEVYIVDPGLNQVFDGVLPIGDDVVTSFDTEILAGVEGVLDIQGVSYEETRGNLWIIGRGNNRMAEVSVDGTLINLFLMRPYLLLDQNDGDATDNNLAGITIGPSTDPNIVKIFIADRGIDNMVNPNENDGQTWEFNVSVDIITTPPPLTLYLPLLVR